MLALAGMMMGVPRAVGLDIDADALKIAGENARLNNLADRMQFVLGGPDVVQRRLAARRRERARRSPDRDGAGPRSARGKP